MAGKIVTATSLMLNGHVMSSTIAVTSSVAHVPTRAVPPATTAPPANRVTVPAAARSSAAPAAPSSAQESAELNQLLAKYKNDLSHGQAASTLSGLSRQIMAAAKDARQHVSLPRASANSGVPAAPPVTNTASETGKVNLVA
jgi:hypothetical protein